MRILIAHEAPAGGGGVESYLAAIMPALLARGHQLAFLCDTSRTHEGPTRLDGLTPAFSAADDGLPQAVERVRSWGPDVCFSHNMGRLELEERVMSFAPVVKMMHGYFGTCVSSQKAHAFPRMQACSRTFGLPCLGLYMPRRCGQLRPALMMQQFRWTSRQHGLFDRYEHVVVASSHMAREYERHGVNAEHLTVAPLFATEPSAPTPRVPPLEPTVLFLGRMTRLKGGDVLIHAAEHASRLLGKPVRLLFAGNGPAEEPWRELARRLKVEATFCGWLAGKERTDVLRRASLIAVPSLWPEPFGLVGLEAAVHGVPAIAFDTGGIGEWLHDDVNGRLVGEAGSAEALGSALAQVLTGTIELERLGQGALRVASTLTSAAHLDIIGKTLGRAALSSQALA
jgi:glycosyltransferase involved in cell wall biosynthesis